MLLMQDKLQNVVLIHLVIESICEYLQLGLDVHDNPPPQVEILLPYPGHLYFPWHYPNHSRNHWKCPVFVFGEQIQKRADFQAQWLGSFEVPARGLLLSLILFKITSQFWKGLLIYFKAANIALTLPKQSWAVGIQVSSTHYQQYSLYVQPLLFYHNSMNMYLQPFSSI